MIVEALRVGILFSYLFEMILAFMIVASSPSRGHAAEISHIGTNQRVLVICVKWADQPTTRLGSCNDWATLLQNEVNAFYNQTTFGLTTFQFDSPVGAPNNGWLSLGYKSEHYEFFKTGQDAINLADPYVDFSNYHRVAVITNHPDFGGQGGPGWYWQTDEGAEANINSVDNRFMSLSIINEWQNDLAYGLPFDTAGSVLAHELGHHLGLKTHYGDVIWFPTETYRDLLTPWDVMGLSPGMNHFLSWAKFERTWIQPAGIQRLDPPTNANTDVTITLSPNELSGGTQLIEVPIAAIDPAHPVFTGYAIENRRPINGDQNLPTSGVLVTFVDESPNSILKAIVLDDPGSPGDLNQATLELGDSISDAAHNITITYVSQNGNDSNVRIQYKLPPAAQPNLQINPWGAPPWETQDIWLDSEKNGFGTFKYTDSQGKPAGNGDDAWVDHVNRVYFKIKNSGSGVATNVRVEAYANSPPGMGDQGADWAYLGTAIFPNIAENSSETGYLNWKPTVGQHTCLKVVIIPSENETSSLDNVAQENIVSFDTSANSPYHPRCSRFSVHNPFMNRSTPVNFLMRDIPKGWKVHIQPPALTLRPGGREEVCVSIIPSDSMPEYKPGYIGKPKLEAQIPYADTFVPLGGIDVWTHLTQSSKLSCDDGKGRLGANGAEPRHSAMPARLAPRPGEAGPTSPGAQPNTAKEVESLFARTALVGPEPAPTKVSQVELIKAQGHLEPGFSGARIAVDFLSGDKRVTEFATTDASGAWSATFNPSTKGMWEVKAYYDGDSIHAAAESNRCRFDVDRKSSEGGLCGYDRTTVRMAHLIAAFLSIIALLLFFLAYFKRLCWAYLVSALIVFLLAFMGAFFCWIAHATHSALLFAIGLAILGWWYWRCVAKTGPAITAG